MGMSIVVTQSIKFLRKRVMDLPVVTQDLLGRDHTATSPRPCSRGRNLYLF
ncbi:uncharacterized protein G2W53_017979 [Senna tora]|uniref:Uncharacterized protein n=1 Tax=Senna tora TaxID=362788 RepID=A0A834TR47_9FABA|nr:uncharacterized protein G2W53_017979 [Senna tora]